MRYKELIIERTKDEDPNSWSNRDLGSVLDYINLNNAAFDRDYDLPSDDPIVILGLVGDPKLGVMKKWQEFAGEPTDKDTKVKKTQTKVQVGSAAYYNTRSKDLVQNATLVNDRIAAFVDDHGLVHESIHRGLAMIRDLRGQGLQLSAEANQWLDNESIYNTDGVQASVDHCMIRSIMHGDGAEYCEAFYKQDPQAQKFFDRKWRRSFNDRYVDLTPGRADTRMKQGKLVLGKDREPEEPITDFAEQMRFYFVTLYNDIARATGKFLKTPRFTSPVRPKLRPGSEANTTIGTTIKGTPGVEEWVNSVRAMIKQGRIQDNKDNRQQLVKDVKTLAKRYADPDHYKYILDANNIVDKMFKGRLVLNYDITGKVEDDMPKKKPEQGTAGKLEQYIRSIRDDLKAGNSVDSDTVKLTVKSLTDQSISSDRLRVFTDQLLANGSTFTDQMIRKGLTYLLTK